MAITVKIGQKLLDYVAAEVCNYHRGFIGDGNTKRKPKNKLYWMKLRVLGEIGTYLVVNDFTDDSGSNFRVLKNGKVIAHINKRQDFWDYMLAKQENDKSIHQLQVLQRTGRFWERLGFKDGALNTGNGVIYCLCGECKR